MTDNKSSKIQKDNLLPKRYGELQKIHLKQIYDLQEEFAASLRKLLLKQDMERQQLFTTTELNLRTNAQKLHTILTYKSSNKETSKTTLAKRRSVKRKLEFYDALYGVEDKHLACAVKKRSQIGLRSFVGFLLRNLPLFRS